MHKNWVHGILIGLACSLAAVAADRAVITGRVVDTNGKPVARANVIVYAAGVKVGYSTFCPTCYTDCGKRTVTDAAGSYGITSLDPALWFRLLVVRPGYEPMFVMKVDPAGGPAQDAVVTVRPPVSDPARVLHGRVVNDGGVPLRDAIVKPEGIAIRNVEGHYRYDEPMSEADRLAVTDEHGEFTIVHARPATVMAVMVEARGMAPKRFRDVFMGPDTATLTVTDGALVRGRLRQNGQPVAGAEVGLSHLNQFQGHNFDDIRIGTQSDGSFVIPNVPANEIWYAFVIPQSIAGRGAVQPVKVVTKNDGEEVDLGDLNVAPGLSLRGKVVLTDGKPIPAGMEIRVSQGCESCWSELAIPEPSGMTMFSRMFHVGDTRVFPLSPDGHFEFTGLQSGPYQIAVSVKGYAVAEGFPLIPPTDMSEHEQQTWPRMSAHNAANLRAMNLIETPVTTNVDNLIIKLDPAK